MESTTINEDHKPSPPVCGKCGALLALGAAGGLCPACLLKDGLELLATAAPSEKPGDKIGRYKLLQEIGQGGYGVVYMAEQEEPVRRRVALKVIKLGMDTREVTARFEAERQALALMDHPNIARVFDGGATDAGRPYFVMELVRGIRMTDYCDQNNLSTGQRLDLFMQVCQAVQHAHQKGIIHRDLKPSNILVTLNDGVPVPKVIDFGIAKATEQKLTDKTLFTRLHQFMGTPAYMSPEQAEMTSLDIDTRSDIYSLGVLLYELLTGRTPFDGKELLQAGFDEMRRIIREQEPARPSTKLSTLAAADLTTIAQRRQSEAPKLLHLVRGDLDWIVMKCLEKDRTRRYETANGLAMDLQRHLNEEPVIARPPSIAYKLQKFIHRNRTAAWVLTMLVTALALGFFTTLIALTRARRAQDRAEAAATIAAAINDFLQSAMLSASSGSSGTNASRDAQQTLDQVAWKIDRQFGAQPLIEAAVRFTLGRAYASIGELAAAEGHIQRALEIRRKELGANHPATLEVIAALGFLRFNQGKTQEAESLLQDVLGIQRRVLGEENSATMQTMLMLGAIESQRAGPLGAAKVYQGAIAALRKNRKSIDPKVLEGMLNLAAGLMETRAYQESEKLLRECVARSHELFGPIHPFTLGTMYRLADTLRDEGKIAEAETLGREVLEQRERVFGAEHQATVQALLGLSHTVRSAGRTEECERLRRAALERARKSEGPTGPDALASFNFLIEDILLKQSRYDEAARLLQDELPIETRLLGATNTQTLRTARRLANVSGCVGRWTWALPACLQLTKATDAAPETFCGAAVAALATEDLETYRRLCAECISRFGHLSNPAIAGALARTCLLVSNVPDSRAVSILIDRTISTNPSVPVSVEFRHWGALAKGMMLYRQDRAKESIRWLEPIQDCSDARAAALSAYFCAMAHQSLARRGDASAALVKANQRLSDLLRNGELGETIARWSDLAAALAIRSEAEKAVWGREISSRINIEELAVARTATRSVHSLLRRGNELTSEQRWPEAAASFSQAMSETRFDLAMTSADVPSGPLKIAIAFLRARDYESHTQLCRRGLLASRQATDLEAAERVAKAALISSSLAPELVSQASDVIRLVEAGNTNKNDVCWISLVRGMADYRQQRPDRALNSLQPACQTAVIRCRSTALVFQAMSAKRLGRDSEAYSIFRQAKSLVAEVKLQATNSDCFVDWQILEIALQEANQLFTQL